jgi:Uma2 family endonuclease
MSVEEYTQYELKSERCHEYIDGQLFEMWGEKDTNIEITNFLTYFFFSVLKEKGYTIYPHDMKVATPGENKFYYPDWLITSEPKTAENRYIKYHPELIIEVVSKNSYIHDTVNKFIDYTKIPSLKYYLIINPKLPAITVYSKDAVGEWMAEAYSKPADIINLPLLQLNFPIREIFEIAQEGNASN